MPLFIVNCKKLNMQKYEMYGDLSLGDQLI